MAVIHVIRSLSNGKGVYYLVSIRNTIPKCFLSSYIHNIYVAAIFYTTCWRKNTIILKRASGCSNCLIYITLTAFFMNLCVCRHIAAIVTKELLTKQVPRDHSTVNLHCVGGEFHSPARLQSTEKYKRRLASLIRSAPIYLIQTLQQQQNNKLSPNIIYGCI